MLSNNAIKKIRYATRAFMDNNNSYPESLMLKIHEVEMSSAFIKKLISDCPFSTTSAEGIKLEKEIGDVILDEWEKYE